MLNQTLSINNTTASVAALLSEWRKEMGNLAEQELPVAFVVSDVLQAIGLPENAIRMVLAADEFDPIEHVTVPQPVPAPVARCQVCGEEARQIVQHHRRGSLLLCDDHRIILMAR